MLHAAERMFDRFRRNNKTLLFLLAITPFLVYFDVFFLHYTMSSNEVSIHPHIHFGNLLPVADPAAGSLQDHPWLFKIGKSLRQGFIPLINLNNGLGDSLLESLQSGVFYPLNLLLVFMDLSSPHFFDVFSILHVLILSFNSFFLFKLYIRWEIASVLASAFALSPLTFAQVNMVHYRAFVWTLLIIWSSVCIARGRQSVYTILIAVGAIICSLTAGNPQESFFGIIAAVAFFTVELFHSRKMSRKAFFVFALSLSAGLLISFPSVLPFLVSKGAGLLTSVEDDVARASTLISMKWLFCWFIPYINGSYPKFYRVSELRGEFPTFSLHPLFVFLTIAGFWIIFMNKEDNLKGKAVFVTLFTVGVLGIASTCEASPFQQIIQHIPFVKSIRITKYTSYIHLFFAVCASLALSWLIDISFSLRRRVVSYSLLTSGLLVLTVVLLQVFDRSWKFNFSQFDQILLVWLGCVISIVAVTYFLLRAKKGFNYSAFWGLLLLGTLLMRPYGFFKAVEHYSPFPIQGLDFSKERILSNADTPNSNILRSYKRVEVFNAILNRSFSSFINKSFNVISPGTQLQLPKDSIVTKAQLSLLRLMGVTSIYGYPVEDDGDITRINDSFTTIQNFLPQTFLLQSSTSLETYCQAGNYSEALRLIQSLMVAQAINGVKEGANNLAFTLDRSGRGTLVSLQAFAPGWQFEGKSASRFCGVFNSWQGTFEAGKPYLLKYEPLGLRMSYPFVFLGILLLVLAIKVRDPHTPKSLTSGSLNTP